MNITCDVPSLSSKPNQSRVWHDGRCVLLRLKIGPRQEDIGRRRRIRRLFFIFSWYWRSKYEDVFAKTSQNLEIDVETRRKDYKDTIQPDSECREILPEKKIQERKDRRTDVCPACEVFFWLDASFPRVETNSPTPPQLLRLHKSKLWKVLKVWSQ